MKLRELMNEIVKPNGPWTQTVAEQRLQIPQWKLSNFKNASDDSEYEKSWQDFLKLLGYCREHGIDPARELPHTAINKIAVGVTDAAIRKATSGAKSNGKRKSQK